MYILFIISLLVLNASDIQKEQPEEQATQLEMFLFKIGFTSLLNDFTNEKNKLQLNSNDIHKLKADIQYILRQMNKNKLSERRTLSAIDMGNEDELFQINYFEAYIREEPYGKSKIIRQVPFGELLDISFCDQYGWCKIKNKEEYIPRFVLRKI
jgi:hypothetical protein